MDIVCFRLVMVKQFFSTTYILCIGHVQSNADHVQPKAWEGDFQSQKIPGPFHHIYIIQSNDYHVHSLIFVCPIQWLLCPFHDIYMSNPMITMSNPWYLYVQSNDYHVHSMIFACPIKWLPCPIHDICLPNPMITMSNQQNQEVEWCNCFHAYIGYCVWPIEGFTIFTQ